MKKLNETYMGYQVFEADEVNFSDHGQFEYAAYDGDDLHVINFFVDDHNKLWFVADDVWEAVHYNTNNTCATAQTRNFVPHGEVGYITWELDRYFIISSMGLVDLYYNKKIKSTQLHFLNKLNRYIAAIVYNNVEHGKMYAISDVCKEDDANDDVIDITPSFAKEATKDTGLEDYVLAIKQSPKLVVKALVSIVDENDSLKHRVAELEAQIDAIRNALN